MVRGLSGQTVNCGYRRKPGVAWGCLVLLGVQRLVQRSCPQVVSNLNVELEGTACVSNVRVQLECPALVPMFSVHLERPTSVFNVSVQL